MGRKRLDDSEKSVTYTISIKKSLLDKLRESGSPSHIIAELIKQYLEQSGKL